MDTRNMRANLQNLVEARQDHPPHHILGIPAQANPDHVKRAYHLLLAMCSDAAHLRDILRRAMDAMLGDYEDADDEIKPYQPYASKTQYWFWTILSRGHHIQEITWPVPHNLKPHVDQGAKNNGAWASFTWLTRTPVDGGGDQQEEQVPAFALHGQLFDHIPLTTELKSVGATQHNGTWHVPFFHPTKPKDPSKQWNAILTWFYMKLPKLLNPDAVRSKSRPSVNNNTVVWSDGTKMKPSCFAKAWTSAEDAPAPPIRKRKRPIQSPRHAIKAPRHAIKAPRHATVMSRKQAIKAPRHATVMRRKQAIKAPRGKCPAAMAHLKHHHSSSSSSEEEEELTSEEEEEEAPQYPGTKNPRIPFMAKRVHGHGHGHSTHTHQAWEQASDDSQSDSDSDSDSESEHSSRQLQLLHNMVEHKVHLNGTDWLGLPHMLLQAHQKMRYGGFSTYAQWITHILSSTLHHYGGVLTMDNCADPHVQKGVLDALDLSTDTTPQQSLQFTTQLLQLHQQVFA